MYSAIVRRSTDSIGAPPAILVTAAAVALGALLATVLGITPGRPETAAAAPTPTPTARSVDTPTVTAQPAPARSFVVGLLGNDPRWGAQIPVPFGCTLPAPVLSAEADGVGVHVFGPGLGGLVNQRIADCGTSSKIGPLQVTTITVDGGRVTAWTRGDVLLTMTTSAAPGAAATDLDTRAVAALTPLCADLSPAVADSTRNPTQGDYVPYTQTVTVSVPPNPDAPDVGTSAPAIPAVEPTRTTVPDGLVGPPLPDPLPRPHPLQWPGLEPLSADVTVPAVDTDGPGCGWAFAGTVPPAADAQSIREAKAALVEAARAQLVSDQQTWATVAAAYVPALAEYTTQVTAWQAYVDQVQAVEDTWADQAADLATYRELEAAYTQAVADLETFMAAQDDAKADYERAMTACHAPQEPGPSRPIECPRRPAILDQAPPTVPDEPTPPILWAPPASTR